MPDEKTQSKTVEAAPAKKSSTQSFLDIDHVRDGAVVMKDGSMKMVLIASAVNFELKSEIERDSIIFAYQSFINSIEAPIQIVMQSRKLDLDNYLETLRERLKKEENELLKVQTNAIIKFDQLLRHKL